MTPEQTVVCHPKSRQRRDAMQGTWECCRGRERKKREHESKGPAKHEELCTVLQAPPLTPASNSTGHIVPRSGPVAQAHVIG